MNPFAEAVSVSRTRIEQLLSDTLGELESTFRKLSAAESERTWANLNEQFSRMRAFESDRAWCEALLDAASLFCGRAAFFSIRKDQVLYQGSRNMPAGDAPPPVAIAAEPAFVIAISNRRSAETDSGAWLIPILLTDRVPGVLYADGASNLPALELIASFAAASLECHLLLQEGTAGQRARVRTSTGPVPPREAAARRWAQVAVANIVLHEFEAVRHGREERSVYSQCTPSIDAAREKYRRDYPGLPDYLHQEIVRTLADNQPELLGTNYPHPRS